MGSGLTRNVTVPAIGLGIGIGVATARLDSLQRGLVAVAGSTAAAQVQLARLTEIAKAPGIGFEEAIQGSVRLQSVGFSAALAERSLKAFANAVALTGGGRAELSRINTQLGQLASKGKVLTQDLRPIIEAGPAVGRALREAFGTVDASAIEELNLTTEQFLDRLLTQLEKLPQVTGGLGNSFENLKDAVFRAFAGAGIGQASALAQAIDSLAKKVEFAGRMFATLPAGTQRSIFMFVALAAALGPVLLAVSALTRAFVTFQALSLTMGGVGLAGLNRGLSLLGTRLWASVVAMRAAAVSAGTLTVAWRGLVSVLTGPVGLTIALGSIAAAFINTKLKAQEAAAEAQQTAEEFTAAIAQMNQAVLNATFESANQAFPKLTASLQREMQELERLRARVRQGEAATTTQRLERGPPVTTLTPLGNQIRRAEGRVAALQELVSTRKAQLDALALEYNTRIAQRAPLGGGGAEAEGDKFKALRKEVEQYVTLLGSMRGTEFFPQASALEQSIVALTARAKDRGDLAALLGILQQLSGALTDFAGNLGATQTEALNRRLADPNFRPADTANVALHNSITLSAQFAASMAGVANRTRQVAERAREAARYIRQMQDVSGLSRALVGVAAQFGRVGESLADTLDRVSAVADALAQLRTLQQESGQGGIFANLSNLTSAVSVLGAALGVLGGLFGESGAERERERRAEENTEALHRLSSQLNRFAGTANEFRRAALAVGALQRAGVAATIGGNVNGVLSQFGLTLADLNRIARGLGITLLTESGRVDLSALEQLSEALGYNAQLVTRFGQTLDDVRRIQDARNRIFNVEVTPQVALQQALAEIGRFAPLISANLLRGVDTSTQAGREALQRAIQQLFERASLGGVSLGEMGLFQDVNQLLESILGIDDALDKFRETTENATNAMLNVPQGFKVALARFNATAPQPAPTAASTGAASSAPQAVQQTSVSGLTFNFTMPATDDPEAMVRHFKQWMQQTAQAYPPLAPLANIVNSTN